ncbi:MAG: SMC-Scp complex subunit ScpB [bacterium]
MIDELKRIVEALLFATSEPLTPERIASIVSGVKKEDIEQAINELSEEYDGAGHSFQLVRAAGGFQVTTREDYSVWVSRLHDDRARQKLSKPALETLAIIAYKQPVLRSTIEAMRGVNVDGVLRTLMERNLIRIVGRAEGPGRPLLFGTTRQFLVYFGLNKLTDLPSIEEIDMLMGNRNPDQRAGYQLSNVPNSNYDSADPSHSEIGSQQKCFEEDASKGEA